MIMPNPWKLPAYRAVHQFGLARYELGWDLNHSFKPESSDFPVVALKLPLRASKASRAANARWPTWCCVQSSTVEIGTCLFPNKNCLLSQRHRTDILADRRRCDAGLTVT
jgi:hypothetical protein